MRSCVPISLQGRIFSARDTVQNIAIPLGLYLGGLLTDHVFEPLAVSASPVQTTLAAIFGSNRGGGIALLFLLTSLLGLLITLICMGSRQLIPLDSQEWNNV